MAKINQVVYETSIKEIEKLDALTIQEIERHPLLLKTSQLKNSHVLALIKQQEIDYKEKDLTLRTTMYDLRQERNGIMKDNIKLQEQKLK
ncbi:MAG: hypothetical protein PHF05_00145 [Candidatus Izemoplasmatales bacterium]|nr:hypothetical protein [Candidatus Izemoplasmatales bacterium]